MPRFFKKSSLVVIIVLSIALIALMFYTSNNRGSMTALEGFIGQIVAPFQRGMYTVSSTVYNFFSMVEERRSMRSNYEELKEKVANLEKELVKLEELEKENKRLKELLRFSNQNEEFVVTGARVIAKNPGNWFNLITIDKGKKDGISVNMAVVTEKGLVGRVVEVAERWSKVRTIVDGQSAVSAIIQRNRDNGIVKGNNSLVTEDGMCRMIYLPEDSSVVEGDKVITSGLGDIFPKGIYIGEVKEVIKEERNLYKTAIIEPGADFERLEEVLVVVSSREANETRAD